MRGKVAKRLRRFAFKTTNVNYKRLKAFYKSQNQFVRAKIAKES